MPLSPLTPIAGGVRLAVKLTPKASRNRIEGIACDAAGEAYLKVSVTAVPEHGKANEALIALLAKSWKLGKRAITIAGGATDRRKTIVIEGDAGTIGASLAASVRDK